MAIKWSIMESFRVYTAMAVICGSGNIQAIHRGALPCSSSSPILSAQRTRRISRGCACASAATNGRPGAAERQEYRMFDEGNESAARTSGRNDRNQNAATTKKVFGDDDQGNFGDRPYRTIPGLGKYYLDELDVITLLDPPYLSPLDPANYSHASYIWKKIGDVPEERRVRLLNLMSPSLIQAVWKIAGQRYDTPKLFAGDAFTLLPAPDIEEPFRKTIWSGKLDGDIWPWSWMRDTTAEFFIDKNGGIGGQLSCAGLFGSTLSRYMALYFRVLQAEFVSVTNEECDLVLDFSGGQVDLKDELPPSFRKPDKLSWPLEDFVVYIRPAGPGVLAGQVWEKRSDPNQAPPRKVGNLVLIKRFGDT